jgi:hypothetical protein
MDPWADPDYVRDERENDPPARGAAVIADRRCSGVNDHAPAAPLAPVAVLVKYGLWPNTHTERDTDVTDDEIVRML